MKFNKSKMHKTVIILITVFVFLFLCLRFTPYPQLKKIRSQDYSSRVYDCNGNLLQVISLSDGLRREWTSVDDIPKEIKKVFIKSEDKNFYFHLGIDFFAIIKATFQNLNLKRTVRGASTISMQLVRIISPSSENSKRTIKNKIFDAINALRIETRLSKKQILELYLNNVPFGMNCEGVTTAARTIYGKNLNELTNEEICCLAVIPRRPSDNNPLVNPQLCSQKAEVLYKSIYKTDCKIDCNNLERYIYPYEMPHYINFIKNEIRNKNEKLPSEIHLAVDLDLYYQSQKFAMQALEGAEGSRISNAAILVIDNDNNSVLSWVGNADWKDEEHSGQVDGVLVENQPGSSMKPFLYALGLETKYTPTSILADVPREFGDKNVYIPANFNNRFNGPVRYRVALASSLNIPAVTVLSEVGVLEYLEVLGKLGFKSLERNGEAADLGLALGAGEVTLKELVPAFSTFVHDGKYYQLNYEKDSVLSKPVQVYEPDTARIICSFLSDVSARAKGFGYTQTFQTSYPSIFKTGTSNQYQNIVALGATKKWTVGVWMGNFSGETVIGKTGSSLPALVAKQILDYLMGSLPSTYDAEFEKPEEYELKPICAVSGMEPGKNCNSIVYEYQKKNSINNYCTWHRNNDEINYPSEYQQWFRLAYRNGKVDYNDSNLRILTPNNNSIFFYDVTKKEKMAINVEVTGGQNDILLVDYDGSFYTEVDRPFVFELPIEHGKHIVKIKCGNESEILNFEVK